MLIKLPEKNQCQKTKGNAKNRVSLTPKLNLKQSETRNPESKIVRRS